MKTHKEYVNSAYCSNTGLQLIYIVNWTISIAVLQTRRGQKSGEHVPATLHYSDWHKITVTTGDPVALQSLSKAQVDFNH